MLKNPFSIFSDFRRSGLWRCGAKNSVAGQSFYHVTRRVPYNAHPELMIGNKIEVGNSHNPFFGFYECPRTYNVDTPHGALSYKAMRFLSAVKTGEIQHPESLARAHEVAEHYLMLARELIMEEVRKEIAPNSPSRQSCLWMVRTLKDAKTWQVRLGGPSKIVGLKIIKGRIHNADAALLLGDSEPLTVTYERARKYWRGEVSDRPELELLFSGVAQVVSISD